MPAFFWNSARKQPGTPVPRRARLPLPAGLARALLLLTIPAWLFGQDSSITVNPAGNGRDNNDRTFHFFPDSRDRPLADTEGKPLNNRQVTEDFGPDGSLFLTLDGEALAGEDSLGWELRPSPRGIDDLDWLDNSFPGRGQIRVDVTRGRIKSNPSLNFKYPMFSDSGFDLGSVAPEHPAYLLLLALDGGDGQNARRFGLVVYRPAGGSVYKYGLFTTGPDTPPTTWNNGNTDDGQSVFIPGGTRDLPGSEGICRQAEKARSLDLTRGSFALQCGTRVYYWELTQSTDLNAMAGSPTGTINSVSTNTSADAVQDQSSVKPKIRLFGMAYQNNDLKIVYTRDTGSGTEVRLHNPDTLVSVPEVSDYSDTYGGAVWHFGYGNARSPAIDCFSDVCFVVWSQLFNPTSAPGSKEFILLGRRFGDITDNALRRINDSTNTAVSQTAIVATGYRRALFAFHHERLYEPDDGDSKFYPASSMAYYKGRTSCDPADFTPPRTPPASCWPDKMDQITYGGNNGPDNRWLSTVENISPVRYSFLVPERRRGSRPDTSVNRVMALWSQPATTNRLVDTASANRLYYRVWQYENLSSSLRDIPVMTNARQLGSGDGEMESFRFSWTENGQGRLTYLQDGRPYFHVFNGTDFRDNQEMRVSTNNDALALEHTWSRHPRPSESAPSDGQTLITWIEDNRLYLRVFLDQIRLEARYYPQEYGPVLTPAGKQTPLLRNNYARPGDDRPVDIYVNKRNSSDRVTVRIFTLGGRLIKTIKSGARVDSFSQPLQWDRTNRAGEPVASGLYRIVVSGGGKTETGVAVIVK